MLSFVFFYSAPLRLFVFKVCVFTSLLAVVVRLTEKRPPGSLQNEYIMEQRELRANEQKRSRTDNSLSH